MTAGARRRDDRPLGRLRFLRPERVVLSEKALVPESNLVRPAPTSFTHELVVDEPFRLDRPGPGREPDGVLPAGTPVALVLPGVDRCRVAHGSGLAVEVRRASLRRLPRGGEDAVTGR